MAVDTPEKRHEERRHGERRRNNRRTTDPLVAPPYFEVFDRMAAALEDIEFMLASLASPPGTDQPEGDERGQSDLR